jgi:hypothetical protein
MTFVPGDVTPTAPAYTAMYNPAFPDCIEHQYLQEARDLCSATFVKGYSTSGLGDAASDYRSAYSAFLSDHRDWVKERDYREQRINSHHAWVDQVADHAAWEVDYAEWQRLRDGLDACSAQWDQYRADLEDAQQGRSAVENYYRTIGLNIERHWGQDPSVSCTNQLQKDQWASLCQTTRRDPGFVRGLDGEVQRNGIYYGTDASGNLYCALAELPLCQAMPQDPQMPGRCPHDPGNPPREPTRPGNEPSIPSLRAEPQPPPVPAGIMPACIPYDQQQEAIRMCQGTSGLRGLGVLPEVFASNPCAAAALTVCPGTEPGPDPSPDPTEPAKRSNMMIGGILLLLVVGGGYGIYRSMKK